MARGGEVRNGEGGGLSLAERVRGRPRSVGC